MPMSRKSSSGSLIRAFNLLIDTELYQDSGEYQIGEL
jgi:hypothetical protein